MKRVPKWRVVNESFARHYWGNENPMGKQFHEVDKKELLTVVGVVEDAKYRDFRKAAPPTVYLPLRQCLRRWVGACIWRCGPTAIHTRSSGPYEICLNRQLKDVSTKFQTFTELIDERLLYERLLTALSVSFGGLGILICAVGIYGVAAYSVSRRTAEIGIRMALGATPSAVMRLILREQMVLVCAGLCAGSAERSR